MCRLLQPPGFQGGRFCSRGSRADYRAHGSDAYDFVPLSHAPYFRLGGRDTEHLSKLADIADCRGDVRRGIFVRNAWRRPRLSVALCKGNVHMLRVYCRCAKTC